MAIFSVTWTAGDPSTLAPLVLNSEAGELTTWNITSADSPAGTLSAVPLQIQISKYFGFAADRSLPDARFSNKDVGGAGHATANTLNGDTVDLGGRAWAVELKRTDSGATIRRATWSIGGASPTVTPPTLPALPNTVYAGPSDGTNSGEGAFRFLVAADIPALPYDPSGSAAAVAASLASYLTTTAAAATYAPKLNPTFTGGITVGPWVMEDDGILVNQTTTAGFSIGLSVSLGGNGLVQIIGLDGSLQVDGPATFGRTINGNTITTGSGTLTLSTFTVTAAANATISGTNTGDQDLSGLAPKASPTLTSPLLQGIGEKSVSLGASLSGTVTCNYANGEVQYGTLVGATTLAFSNPPASGTSGTLTVILTGDGTHSVTFPAAVSWGDAGAPTQPFAAKRYYLTFTTHDAGTHWDAVAVGGFS